MMRVVILGAGFAGLQVAPADVDLLAEGGPRFRLDPPTAVALDAKGAFERERWFGAELAPPPRRSGS